LEIYSKGYTEENGYTKGYSLINYLPVLSYLCSTITRVYKIVLKLPEKYNLDPNDYNLLINEFDVNTDPEHDVIFDVNLTNEFYKILIDNLKNPNDKDKITEAYKSKFLIGIKNLKTKVKPSQLLSISSSSLPKKPKSKVFIMNLSVMLVKN
jgi:hypothetical protein